MNSICNYFLIIFLILIGVDSLVLCVGVISHSKTLMRRKVFAEQKDPTLHVTEMANAVVDNVNVNQVMLANFVNAPGMNVQKVNLIGSNHSMPF